MDQIDSQTFSMTPETFRKRLREEVEGICTEFGLDFQTHKQKGWAFQRWCAHLLKRAHRGVDTSLDDALFESHDLQLDVVLEDTVSEKLIMAQCKCESLQSSPPTIDDTPVESFFARHKHLVNREWVRKHGSGRLFQVISDLAERLNSGWSIDYYFISTNGMSSKVLSIADKYNSEYAATNQSIKCVVLGRAELKDFYLRTTSLEGGVGVELSELLPADSYFYRSHPYPTIVASVRSDWIRNVYNRGGARERIFALNIRDWLGRRTGINKQMVETIKTDAENFFYYNNGISAICTDLQVTKEARSVRIAAENFQIINGAQTVGAIVDAPTKGEDAWVLIRISETSSAKSERKSINDNIIRFNNTQNVVKVSDFCSNDAIQKWLEEELGRHKTRPHLPAITYQRRRGTARARKGSSILRLEDLGKLRYAFRHEPTKVINSPKDLFIRRSDHSEGAYEDAFGVDGKYEVMWTNAQLSECLLAIAFYLAIDDRIAKIRVQEPALSYLNQLKFFLVSMAGELSRCNQWDDKRIGDLVNSEKSFYKEFDLFWPQAVFAIGQEWKRNEKQLEPMTLRTLARSKIIWDTIKDTFLDLRKLGITP